MNKNNAKIKFLLSDFLKTICIFFIATLLAFILVRVSALYDNIFSVYILAVVLWCWGLSPGPCTC